MESPAASSEAERERRLAEWSASSGVDLASLDGAQRAVVFAALTFMTYVGGHSSLRRLVAYMLSHCGLGLTSGVVGAVVGTTDRAVRKGRQYAPREFWQRLQKAKRGHPAPKLRRDQVPGRQALARAAGLHHHRPRGEAPRRRQVARPLRLPRQRHRPPRPHQGVPRPPTPRADLSSAPP